MKCLNKIYPILIIFLSILFLLVMVLASPKVLVDVEYKFSESLEFDDLKNQNNIEFGIVEVSNKGFLSSNVKLDNYLGCLDVDIYQDDEKLETINHRFSLDYEKADRSRGIFADSNKHYLTLKSFEEKEIKILSQSYFNFDRIVERELGIDFEANDTYQFIPSNLDIYDSMEYDYYYDFCSGVDEEDKKFSIEIIN